ncbi:uncharacterized protein LOC119662505 [Teleopsis dalmanni]|uniref:uncharacterized protein LOC119662505 n=1 Tax=Teleopsis dalmanni TaxID=139649 RepID=UPI0018CF5E84|nr:uncharacterized protein LOC119662505 [Teleopsis dalmanni]
MFPFGLIVYRLLVATSAVTSFVALHMTLTHLSISCILGNEIAMDVYVNITFLPVCTITNISLIISLIVFYNKGMDNIIYQFHILQTFGLMASGSYQIISFWRGCEATYLYPLHVAGIITYVTGLVNMFIIYFGPKKINMVDAEAMMNEDWAVPD